LNDVIDLVQNHDHWGALVILPNASQNLVETVYGIRSGALPEPVLFVFDEGRGSAINSFMAPHVRAIINYANGALGAKLVQNVAMRFNTSASAADTAAMAQAAFSSPSAIATPVSYKPYNLHPTKQFILLLVIAMCPIYQWVMSNTSITATARTAEGLIGLVRPVNMMIFRTSVNVVVQLYLSFIMSVCVAGFASLDGDTFFKYWMWSWMCMCCFASVGAVIYILLGEPGQLLATIFMLLNLASSGSNLPLQLQNPFFRIGMGLPMYHAIEGTRYVLFGSDTIGVHAGVLWIYFAFNMLLGHYIIYNRLDKKLKDKLKQSSTLESALTQSAGNTTSNVMLQN
jgi:ABC-type polysaccharide/polyol phosphate export permease